MWQRDRGRPARGARTAETRGRATRRRARADRASWARLLQEVHSSCLTDEARESLRFRPCGGASGCCQVIVPSTLIFARGGRVFADEPIVLEPGHGEVQRT